MYQHLNHLQPIRDKTVCLFIPTVRRCLCSTVRQTTPPSCARKLLCVALCIQFTEVQLCICFRGLKPLMCHLYMVYL